MAKLSKIATLIGQLAKKQIHDTNVSIKESNCEKPEVGYAILCDEYETNGKRVNYSGESLLLIIN